MRIRTLGKTTKIDFSPVAYAGCTNSADLVEEISRKLQAGTQPDLDAYRRDYPQHAERLADLLPAIQLLASCSRNGAGDLPLSEKSEKQSSGPRDQANDSGRRRG